MPSKDEDFMLNLLYIQLLVGLRLMKDFGLGVIPLALSPPCLKKVSRNTRTGRYLWKAFKKYFFILHFFLIGHGTVKYLLCTLSGGTVYFELDYVLGWENSLQCIFILNMTVNRNLYICHNYMKPTQLYNIENYWFHSLLNGQCYLISGVLEKSMHKPRIIQIKSD